MIGFTFKKQRPEIQSIISHRKPMMSQKRKNRSLFLKHEHNIPHCGILSRKATQLDELWSFVKKRKPRYYVNTGVETSESRWGEFTRPPGKTAVLSGRSVRGSIRGVYPSPVLFHDHSWRPSCRTDRLLLPGPDRRVPEFRRLVQ